MTVAGLSGHSEIKCSREVIIKPEKSLNDAVSKGSYDVVVLPGGLQGSENLAKVRIVFLQFLLSIQTESSM